MTRKEAISYIHNQIKNATPEQLRNITCGINSPLCSNNCPLRQNNSCECAKIMEETENDRK